MPDIFDQLAPADRERIDARIAELPFWRRWIVRRAINESAAPIAGLGCGTIVIAVIIGFILSYIIASCR